MADLYTPNMFDDLPSQFVFRGETFVAEFDAERLTGLWNRVWELMIDGKWRTLAEIQAFAGGSEGGCGARLRDFRKAIYGGHTVERGRRGDPKSGLFEYRLIQRI